MVNERDTGDRVTNTTNQITRKQPVHMGGRDRRPISFSAFDEETLLFSDNSLSKLIHLKRWTHVFACVKLKSDQG